MDHARLTTKTAAERLPDVVLIFTTMRERRA